MSKIYSSFEELLESNKGLFNFLLKSGHTGLLRACWDARNAEIESIKNQALQSSKRSHEKDAKIIELEKKLISSLDENKKLEKNITESAQYAADIKKYADELLSRQKSLELEVEELIKKNQAEETKNLQAKGQLEDLKLEYSLCKEELEKAQAFVEKLNVYAEKSNQYAEKTKQELEKVKQEAVEYRSQIDKEQTLSRRLLTNNEQLQREVENLNLTLQLATDQVEMFKATDKERLVAIEEKESEIENKIILIEKLKAEAEQAKAGMGQWKNKYDKIFSEADQNRLFAEELESYVNELREEGVELKRNLELSLENTEKLKEYAESLQITLEREKTQHRISRQRISQLENLSNQLTSDKEVLKAEVSRFKKIVNNIEKGLEGVYPSEKVDKNSYAEKPREFN